MKPTTNMNANVTSDTSLQQEVDRQKDIIRMYEEHIDHVAQYVQRLEVELTTLQKALLHTTSEQIISHPRESNAPSSLPLHTTSHGLAFSEAVFIIGCPRSGTSALAWALGSHPDFWTSAESDFMVPLFGPSSKIKQIYDNLAQIPAPPVEKQRWLLHNKVELEEFMRFIGWGIDQLYLSRSKGKRWVDQSPSYTIIAQDLRDLFPNAKFLHAVRDGRRVVHSMIHSGFPAPWATDFSKACETWVAYVSLGQQLQAALPHRVHEVRNERIENDPKSETAEFLDFLAAEHSDKPAEFLSKNRINSSFATQPEQSKANPMDEWDDQQRAIFTQIAGDKMHELGYSF